MLCVIEHTRVKSCVCCRFCRSATDCRFPNLLRGSRKSANYNAASFGNEAYRQMNAAPA